jgi:hypothetical protein
MNNHTAFFAQIRALIARDEIDTALQQLRTLLDNSPKLDEILLQSARFQGIRKQIRLGLVSHAEANLTQNQIRAGLVDLLSEMEENIGRASNYSDPKIQHLLTTAGAAVPADFLGRERELTEIRQRLAAGQGTLALVNAEGGMGKTTLAAAYWARHKSEYRHLAWLFCDKGILPAMRLQLQAPLDLTEAMNAVADDPDGQMRLVLARMANLPKDCLLVLDNANEPEHIQDFERYCAGLGWHVLITSRCSRVLTDRHSEYPITNLPKNCFGKTTTNPKTLNFRPCSTAFWLLWATIRFVSKYSAKT